MGAKNRERRRSKQAERRQHWAAPGRSGRARREGRATWAEDAREGSLLDATILAAAHAECEGRADGDELLANLCAGTRIPGGRQHVAERLSHLLADHACALLPHGWEPNDLYQVVRRNAGGGAATIIAAVIAEAVGAVIVAGRRLDPCAESWAVDLDAAIAALGLIAHLPVLPDLGSAQRDGDMGQYSADEKLFARVRALLAKAESTDFSEEAEAFMAKAQELMTRHSLNRAVVQGDPDDDARSTTEARRCWLEDPYLPAKALLLTVVAGANRCHAVASVELGFVTVVGHPDDLDVTEVLFTSLARPGHTPDERGPLPPAIVSEVVPRCLRHSYRCPAKGGCGCRNRVG